MNILKHLLLATTASLERSQASKILFWHDTPPELFFSQIEAIESVPGWHIVDAITRPEGEVQVCFDDGLRPLLWGQRDFFLRRKWRPTVFLAVELIGKPGYLTREEILELQQRGFIFQGHGWSHRVLTSFHGEDLKHELVDSRHVLEELLGRPVEEICFPIGRFSDEVLTACRSAGYTKMYASIPGNAMDELFPGVVRRVHVQHYAPQEIRAVLRGGLTPFAWYYHHKHFKHNKI